MSRPPESVAEAPSASRVRETASQAVEEVLAAVASSAAGLSGTEAAARLERFGPNAVRGHRARPWRVLARQVRSPILLLALTLSVAAVVAVGTWLPYSPLSGVLGFTPLPAVFLLALAGMVVVYLFLVEVAKIWYYARLSRSVEPLVRVRAYPHRVARRAARFTARSPQSR